MDLLVELESLAQATSGVCQYDTPANIARWQKLFSLTHTQAQTAISKHINDLSKFNVSDEHWSQVREEMEEKGHDKESYSYYLSQRKTVKPATNRSAQISKRGLQAKYIFKLEHPLDSAAKVQQLAHMPETPETHPDENDETLGFVVVDATVRATIEEYMHPVQPTFAPYRVPADKDLSSVSIAPTLGIDVSLPQNRCEAIPAPFQDQYPVPYFFYGTLAEPSRLNSLLDLGHEPVLDCAMIPRGKLKTWNDKYRALIDGDEKDKVEGWLYVVENKDHEDRLRFFEGGNYEVVRCEISRMNGEFAKSLTFRFCGDEDELW